MAIGKYSHMLVLMIFIGIVYKTTGLHCPSYPKHKAITEGLLTDLALCRSKHIAYNVDICLNGERLIESYYCSTGGCNIFGYNCDGHCLSEKDLKYVETDFSFKCDKSWEIQKLCYFYLTYETTVVFYTPKIEKLCPNIKSECKKAIDKKWKYE